MNPLTPTPVQATALPEEEFKARLAELCAQFGLHGFAIYGRFNEPPTEGLGAYRFYLHTNADRTVTEEAGYYFTDYADRERQKEEREHYLRTKAERNKQ